jgi:hypothetical protein
MRRRVVAAPLDATTASGSHGRRSEYVAVSWNRPSKKKLSRK